MEGQRNLVDRSCLVNRNHRWHSLIIACTSIMYNRVSIHPLFPCWDSFRWFNSGAKGVPRTCLPLISLLLITFASTFAHLAYLRTLMSRKGWEKLEQKLETCRNSRQWSTKFWIGLYIYISHIQYALCCFLSHFALALAESKLLIWWLVCFGWGLCCVTRLSKHNVSHRFTTIGKLHGEQLHFDVTWRFCFNSRDFKYAPSKFTLLKRMEEQCMHVTILHQTWNMLCCTCMLHIWTQLNRRMTCLLHLGQESRRQHSVRKCLKPQHLLDSLDASSHSGELRNLQFSSWPTRQMKSCYQRTCECGWKQTIWHWELLRQRLSVPEQCVGGLVVVTSCDSRYTWSLWTQYRVHKSHAVFPKFLL